MLFFGGSLKFAGVQPHYQQIVHPVRRENSGREHLVGKPFPPIIRYSALCFFLILALRTTCRLRASGRERGVPITRNAAWNNLLDQFDAGRRPNASNESVVSDLLLMSVGVYDITVFRAIDHARAHFQKADQDLETIREEPSPTRNFKPGT